MDWLLALETSSEHCSVAVAAAGCSKTVKEDTRHLPRAHNANILRMVEVLLEDQNVARADVGCVAYSAGPGAFTGVRIAAAVAHGVALGLDVPVVAVDTSKALALKAAATHEVARSQPIHVVRRSRLGWAYHACYAWAQGLSTVEARQADRLIELETLQQRVEESWLVVGDAGKDLAGTGRWLDVTTSAAAVAEIAVATWQAGGAVVPELAVPKFVEGDSPWRKTNA